MPTTILPTSAMVRSRRSRTFSASRRMSAPSSRVMRMFVMGTLLRNPNFKIRNPKEEQPARNASKGISTSDFGFQFSDFPRSSFQAEGARGQLLAQALQVRQEAAELALRHAFGDVGLRQPPDTPDQLAQ